MVLKIQRMKILYVHMYVMYICVQVLCMCVHVHMVVFHYICPHLFMVTPGVMAISWLMLTTMGLDSMCEAQDTQDSSGILNFIECMSSNPSILYVLPGI